MRTNQYVPFLLSGFMLICLHLPLFAQQAAIQDLFSEYERVLHSRGMLPVHNVTNQPFVHDYISRVDTLSSHPWRNIYQPPGHNYAEGNFYVSFYSPEFTTYWRNLRPGGINDGAIWQGRGFTSAVSGGVHLRYRFLSASFRPMFIYHQNRRFPLSRYAGRQEWSEFSHPFYRIDNPQRFGPESFWVADPGQSYIRADYRGFEAGLTNENRWWGPAVHYPIIMSNNAPGFWHYFAGTSTPRDIYIGDLDVTLIWGKLLESDYFDEQSFNDERYITGINLSINPKPVPNLTLGFSRVFYRWLPPQGIPPRDLFRVFEAFTKSRHVTDTNLSGNDEFSQMLSLYGRWVFPESGFELYGEWARNDHSWDLRDALGEPEHSRAYSAGFQKTFTLPNENLFTINAEIAQLEASNTRDLRSRSATYYAHGIVMQGYTHRGQLLGAGIGGGSNSQILHGNYFFSDGKISGWFRRSVYDNDFLYRSDIMLREPENYGMPKYWLHNFELAFGTSIVYFINQWEIQAGFELAREYNEDFIYKNDLTHVMLNLRARYRLSGLR
jgi:hypothetical protein